MSNHPRLNAVIRDVIGNNPAMVADFREIVLMLFRDYEATAFRRNLAIRDITGQFGCKGVDYARVVGALRSGADATQIKRLDEMVAYAEREYPDVLSGLVRGESSSGSSEEALMVLLSQGIQELPKPHDEEILQAALGYVGSGFFEAYDSPAPAAAVRLTNTGVHYKIRGPVQQLAKRWLGNQNPKTLDTIQKRLDEMSEHDRKIVERLIDWPSLKKSRPQLV